MIFKNQVAITITNTGSEQFNVKVSFNIDYMNYSNFSLLGKLRVVWPDEAKDLKFDESYSGSGTLYTFDVVMPHLPVGDSTIYIVYGNDNVDDGTSYISESAASSYSTSVGSEENYTIYTDWARKPDTEKIFYAEIDVLDNSSGKTIYAASIDTVFDEIFYRGAIKSLPSYRRSIKDITYGVQAASYGTLVLKNSDGWLDDDLENYNWEGGEVSIYYGGPDLPPACYTTAVVADITKVKMTDQDVTLELADKALKLNRTKIDATTWDTKNLWYVVKEIMVAAGYSSSYSEWWDADSRAALLSDSWHDGYNDGITVYVTTDGEESAAGLLTRVLLPLGYWWGFTREGLFQVYPLNSPYRYSKKVSYSPGSSIDRTNFPILLKIGESSGSSNCDFHLEGKCENFPYDIRVASGSDGNGSLPLPYALTHVSGTSPNRTAFIWVLARDIDASTSLGLNVWFGNADAEDDSDPDTVFQFWDDFDSFDTAKWNEYLSNGSKSVSNSILTVTGGSGAWEAVGCKTQYSKDSTHGRIFGMFVKIDESDIAQVGASDVSATGSYTGSGTDSARAYHNSGQTNTKGFWNQKEGADTRTARSTDLDSSYHYLQIRWISGHVYYSIDGGSETDISSNVPADNMGLEFRAKGASTHVYVDWAFVAKAGDKTSWGYTSADSIIDHGIDILKDVEEMAFSMEYYPKHYWKIRASYISTTPSTTTNTNKSDSSIKDMYPLAQRSARKVFVLTDSDDADLILKHWWYLLSRRRKLLRTALKAWGFAQDINDIFDLERDRYGVDGQYRIVEIENDFNANRVYLTGLK